MTFNQIKAAQASARLLSHAGGSLEVIKLMKLLYLAERSALQKFNTSITNDRLVSFRNGPALSSTLHALNYEMQPVEGGWETWVSPRQVHRLELLRPATREALDELSDAELQVLDEVWAAFGHMSNFDLINYTHDHCAEWRHPGNSVSDISYTDIFTSVGKDADTAAYLAEEIDHERALDRLLARVG